MKNFKPFFLLILLTGIFWAFRNPAPENKKALVIAIGHYKSGTGWDTLSSLNDERIIRDALTKQGFSRISSVLDEKATLDGIRTEMKNFIQSVKKGDIIYLHFSGHGQQVADNNGDKDEMDGLDECLVPWDAPMTAANGYKGEKHLRDDEFGQWVQVLRDKVGANGDVMVVLDACHSGTALRGDHRPIQRGNARALIPAGMDMTSFTPGREPGAVDNADAKNNGSAQMVTLSACRAHEVNSEYNGFGSLSLAVTRALSKAKPGDSYVQLFSQITTEMATLAPGQTPVMEGQPEHTVFGTSFVKHDTYYQISSVTSTMLWVEGGQLNGVFKGSKVGIMPAGSNKFDASKALYVGTVTYADKSSSLVKLVEKDLTGYNPKQLWLFVIEVAYGENKLTLGSGDGLSTESKKTIKEISSKLKFVEWNEKSADVRIAQNKDSFKLIMADGSFSGAWVDRAESVNMLLQEYMQGKLLREVRFDDPDMRVDLELVPVIIMGKKIVDSVSLSEKRVNGVVELADEEYCLIKLINRGKKDAFVNVLEISPSGSVKVLVPNYKLNENAADFKIKADGKPVTINTFAYQATKPYGKYTLKVFATDVAVSFKNIFRTRGEEAPAGYEHKAAQMFRYTFVGTTRGENFSLAADGGGTTTEFVYVLKR